VTLNVREAQLADTFISAQYLERYRIVPGTAHLDTKDSRPERLLCVKSRGNVSVASTAITNLESGWTSVMEYQLTDERGRLYIVPARPPEAAVSIPVKFGNDATDATTSVTPMTVVDGYPDRKD
jgi:hypothetical protein